MSSKSRFEELVMPLRGAAFNLAYWLLQSRAEAEDVVQEAYLRAFTAFPKFKGDNVRPWLLMIVRNQAYTALDARKRTASVIVLSEDVKARRGGEEPEVASSEASPEADMISEADRKEVLRALAKLPLAYRDVVVLREMENLSYVNISEITGVPIGTVMSRLSRGRAELKKAILRQRAGDEDDAV